MAATISEVLGNEAAPPTFTHEGRTYQLSKFSQRLKSEYENWLVRHAIDAEEVHLRGARRRWQDATIAADKARAAAKASPSDEDVKAAMAAAEQSLADEEGMLEEARDGMRGTKAAIAVG